MNKNSKKAYCLSLASVITIWIVLIIMQLNVQAATTIIKDSQQEDVYTDSFLNPSTAYTTEQCRSITDNNQQYNVNYVGCDDSSGSSYQRSAVKFDISAISGTVTNAVFRIFVIDTENTPVLNLISTNNNAWSEEAEGSIFPAYNPTDIIGAFSELSVIGEGWNSYNITSHIQNLINTNSENVSLVLTGTEAAGITRYFNFVSNQDSTVPSLKPVLEITYIPAAANTATPTNTPTPTATVRPTVTPTPTLFPPDFINPRLLTDMKKYIPGDIVPLTLKLDNIGADYKTNSVTFEIEYDESMFELVGNDPNIAIVNGYIPFNTKMNIGSGANKRVSITYIDIDDDISLQEGNSLFTVKFKVRNNPRIGTGKFVLKPVSMLDSSGKVYNIYDDRQKEYTVDVTNDAVVQGEVSIYLGDSDTNTNSGDYDTNLNSGVLERLNQAQLNDTFRNLKFTLKHSEQDTGTVLVGSEVFIPDENGNLAVKGADNKVTGRFRVYTQDTLNTIVMIDGVGYLKESISVSVKTGEVYMVNTPVELYPGDLGRIEARQLVLSPDGRITNIDFSAWLQIYNNSKTIDIPTEDKLRADFTKDGMLDSEDFSLWMASYRKMLQAGR